MTQGKKKDEDESERDLFKWTELKRGNETERKVRRETGEVTVSENGTKPMRTRLVAAGQSMRRQKQDRDEDTKTKEMEQSGRTQRSE